MRKRVTEAVLLDYPQPVGSDTGYALSQLRRQSETLEGLVRHINTKSTSSGALPNAVALRADDIARELAPSLALMRGQNDAIADTERAVREGTEAVGTRIDRSNFLLRGAVARLGNVDSRLAQTNETLEVGLDGVQGLLAQSIRVQIEQLQGQRVNTHLLGQIISAAVETALGLRELSGGISRVSESIDRGIGQVRADLARQSSDVQKIILKSGEKTQEGIDGLSSALSTGVSSLRAAAAQQAALTLQGNRSLDSISEVLSTAAATLGRIESAVSAPAYRREAKGHFEDALDLAQRGMVPEALEAFADASVGYRGDYDFLFAYGSTMLLDPHQQGGAIAVLNRATQAGCNAEERRRVSLMIAEAQAQTGQLEAALPYFREALRGSRSHREKRRVLMTVAHGFIKEGNVEAAIPVLRSAWRQSYGPKEGKELIALVVYAYQASGQIKQAIKTLRKSPYRNYDTNRQILDLEDTYENLREIVISSFPSPAGRGRDINAQDLHEILSLYGKQSLLKRLLQDPVIQRAIQGSNRASFAAWIKAQNGYEQSAEELNIAEMWTQLEKEMGVF